MEACDMKRTPRQSHRLLAMCIVTLMGCTSSNEQTSQDASAMSGVAMVDQICSLCHGLTGESASPMFPKLAGQQKEYLKLQLGDFKRHLRSDTSGAQYMRGFDHLTETQITELADYFSRQSPMKADADSADARGESIYGNGIPESGVARCGSCHGAGGEGNGRIPRVAGQHAEYAIRQIKVLQQTEQRPRDDSMKSSNHSLSEADTESVARYMATLGAQPQ